MPAEHDLLAAAVARLRAGELVVLPTETVYGLAADAENPAAVARIFALKGRPPSRPLIVHLAGLDQLDLWAESVPDYARRLAAWFWPGPLTLVLPRGARVPDAVTGGQDSVALRVPDQPLALALLRRFGGGLAAPSANCYGRISPTTPAHVRAQFGEATPLILDGGPCRGGIESTIVGCLGARPRILRPGLIGAAAVAEVAGLPVSEGEGGEETVRAPGQDASHYAPTTPSFLLPRSGFAAWAAAGRGRIGFLGFAPPGMVVVEDLRLPEDAEGAARALYAALHRLDAAGCDSILIEAPPPGPEWEGIRDRLRRATAGR